LEENSFDTYAGEMPACLATSAIVTVWKPPCAKAAIALETTVALRSCAVESVRAVADM
jgi:hypothetical protein